MDIMTIYNQLMQTPYSQNQKISDLEIEIYNILEKDKNNAEALILLLQIKIMLGKKEDAKNIANKIWEEIDEVATPLYVLYINNLINIGLIEMASKSIKPFFDDISLGVDIAMPIMTKYATIIGSLNLMSKTAIAIGIDNEFGSVADLLKQAKYNEQLKDIAKIILTKSQEKAICYETIFYDDENTSAWAVDIYINDDNYAKAELKNKIEMNIDEYFKQNQPQYWLAPIINVLNISEHSAEVL